MNTNNHLQNSRSNAEQTSTTPEPTIAQILLELVLLVLKCIWIVLEHFVKLFLPVTEKSVNGEIVVITGGGHGIGRELAYEYASNGATVVCLDINKEGNEETVKEISRLRYTKAHAYVCDVTNREQVFSVAKQISQEVGNVSILINNAGVLYVDNILQISPEAIEKTIKINTIAHFWTIKAFLPKMLELNHGHIVALSSCSGLVGLRYLTAYTASKFAVRGLMESLYNELRVDPKNNVKLTTIYPHIVDTGLCKRPSMRLPTYTPIIRTTDAAKHIISAQRRNVLESCIPSAWFITNTILRLLPAPAADAFFDFIEVYLKPDS